MIASTYNYHIPDMISISKMYFRYWEPPGLSERMWTVNLEVSISGEYLGQGGNSGQRWK